MGVTERFLRYVKVHTASDPTVEGRIPSAEREFDLAHMLADELRGLGLEGVRCDDKAYVYGFLPATAGCESAPKVGFIAHMDTAPDFCGENVQPIVHENYDGGDVELKGRTIRVADFPHMKKLAGRTLITADGTTLLGGDDKAGVAEIMTMLERLIGEGIPHGRVAVGFTPDEEVGAGADAFDVAGFGCDFAYTVDGGEEGGIDYENFNAAGANFTVHGFNVHPGSSKDTMINASLVAMEINAMLPAGDTPRL
ncbi:MAG: tripeptide aminopeptidase PepT, partial [Candidatus Fimadaptatus sp.]